MNKFFAKIKPVLDTLKIAKGLHKAVIPFITLRSLVEALLPYTSWLMMAILINQISSKIDIKSIVITASVGVLIIFFLRSMLELVKRKCNVLTEYCYKLYNTKAGEKALDMDYPQLVSRKTHEIRRKIREDNNWGAGIYSVFSCYSYVCSSLISIITAFVIMIPLLKILAADDISNITQLMIYMTVVVVITILTLIFRRFAERKKYSFLNDLSDKAKLFWFFIFDGSFGYKQGKDVRLYKVQDLIEGYGNKAIENYEGSNGVLMHYAAAGNAMTGATYGLIEGSAYIMIALKALSGLLGIGSVVLYAGTVKQFAKSLSNLVVGIGDFMMVGERFTSSVNFLRIPDVLVKGSIPVEKRKDYDYDIEFKNVSFKYPGADEYVLKNMTMKLHIGQRLAVVGMNGSGKTTMIKLLCRLYDPTEGEILLNGVNIMKYDYDEYQMLFSVVFQDFKLFSYSLGQNVAADVDYDPEKATICLEESGMGERLGTMIKGLETQLYSDFDDEGVEISGGEAQKIALARALYKDSPIMILDEPTAALDPIAEYEVYSNFNNIVKDKTAVFISHRLSSCRFCHDIAVFHEGRIVQRGSHKELLKDNEGKYAELWKAQSQYYTE